MDKPFYELSNAEFLPWLVNFIKIVTENKADLPITEAQIDALEARLLSHETKLNTQIAIDEAAKAATRDMGDDRVISNSEISYFNTIFKANKLIPRELIIQMGFRLSEGRTSPPPNEPTNLIITTNTAGYTELKWNKNGNKPNTIFEIEAQYEGSSDWVYVDAVQGAKYRHLNQTVGKQVVYRIRAKRAGQESPFSSSAVAYYKS